MYIRGTMLAAALLLTGCGDDSDANASAEDAKTATVQEARAWLTEQGFSVDQDGAEAALKSRNAAALGYFVAAERNQPRYVARVFVMGIGKCRDAVNYGNDLDAETCKSLAKAVIDAGLNRNVPEPYGGLTIGSTLNAELRNAAGNREAVAALKAFLQTYKP